LSFLVLSLCDPPAIREGVVTILPSFSRNTHSYSSTIRKRTKGLSLCRARGEESSGLPLLFQPYVLSTKMSRDILLLVDANLEYKYTCTVCSASRRFDPDAVTFFIHLVDFCLEQPNRKTRPAPHLGQIMSYTSVQRKSRQRMSSSPGDLKSAAEAGRKIRSNAGLRSMDRTCLSRRIRPQRRG
jgi:hypothetical protein